jgi:hypothetical protein
VAEWQSFLYSISTIHIWFTAFVVLLIRSVKMSIYKICFSNSDVMKSKVSSIILLEGHNWLYCLPNLTQNTIKATKFINKLTMEILQLFNCSLLYLIVGRSDQLVDQCIDVFVRRKNQSE